MLPFDRFIIIDWSSRSSPSPKKPSKDAIWVAEGGVGARIITKYFRTRHDCYEYLLQRLQKIVTRKERVLVGWDFAFGYPKGLVKALRLGKGRPWLKIWTLLLRLINDAPDNRNNRFTVGGDLNRRITGGSGPFWGAPAGQSGVFLGSRKDFTYPVKNKRVTLAERRLVERRVRRMQAPWKLAYTGSVGGQSLVGIPRLCLLAHAEPLADVTKVWPFETNFAVDLPGEGPLVLHAEIYPSMLPVSKRDKIADREQVKTYVRWLQDLQTGGRLADVLAGPDDLSAKERKQATKHEGWVLGVE